jgi:hypothetical protein
MNQTTFLQFCTRISQPQDLMARKLKANPQVVVVSHGLKHWQDKQADKITALSNMIQGDGATAPSTTTADPGAQKLAGETTTGNTGGSDQPSVMVKLSAESMKMSFMANSESTSMSSTAQALETMAKKG